MWSIRSTVLVPILALLLPAGSLPALSDEPIGPAWQAEDLINALDVEPRTDDTTERTRGIKPQEGGQAEAPPEPSGGGGVVEDLKILFAFNSAELTPQARRTLDELAVAVTSDRLRGNRFRIAGHTDGLGTESYNLDLSRRRADAVVSYLERVHGISRARLVSEGLGEEDLAEPSNPASAANRRVEVVNLAREQG